MPSRENVAETDYSMREVVQTHKKTDTHIFLSHYPYTYMYLWPRGLNYTNSSRMFYTISHMYILVHVQMCSCTCSCKAAQECAPDYIITTACVVLQVYMYMYIALCMIVCSVLGTCIQEYMCVVQCSVLSWVRSGLKEMQWRMRTHTSLWDKVCTC